MRIARVKVDRFRRFTDLEIKDLPETARLVVMAGPNGCGKSSIFDALNVWYQIKVGQGWAGVEEYYRKGDSAGFQVGQQVNVEVHGDKDAAVRGSFYFRTAYRNEPEFKLGSLNRLGPVADELRFRRMIESDTSVMQNYQRLASKAFEDVFEREAATTTIGAFRERVVGDLRNAVKRLYPELVLNSLGNPLEQGTFRFDKGTTAGFDYMNLSGGEKAAFDLVLDVVVKRPSFQDAIYCIDEPEAHLNPKLQGKLLEELYSLIPEPCQLWVATHSIGMMRKARELWSRQPDEVIFLDFGPHDFDKPVVLTPSRPTRVFWEKVLEVALDDLASLVAPREVIVCEGNPSGAVPSKNAEHDATILNTIFGDELPDTKFIAGGNAMDVAGDRLGFVAALPRVASGIAVGRLIDRDDHSPADVVQFKLVGITTLGRRHLESYTYDDEVLSALCASVSKAHEATALLQERRAAVAASIARGNPSDDMKSAAGEIYVKAKRRLGLTARGNDQMAFARATLAPLIQPGTAIYTELKRDVFGQ